MTQPRSRRLVLVVALALLPAAGCEGDDTSAPSATGARKTAAGATEPTLLEAGTTPSTTDAAGGSGLSSAHSGAPASPSGATTPPGATTKGGGPTTTAPGHPATTTTRAPAGGCPDPRGCPKYTLLGGRWPRDANGVATVHYRVKTSGHSPVTAAPITPEQLIAAVRAAAQTWMDAVPSVRLVYDGTTDEAPNSSNNVVGWGTASGSTGVAETRFTPTPSGPTYSGFSVYLTPTYGFTSRPCDPAHGQPCDDDNSLGVDLHGILTHEWGHVLGLEHSNDQSGTEELTMYSTGGNRRHYVTLGLGDILGARNLYPTNAPMPTLYRP